MNELLEKLEIIVLIRSEWSWIYKGVQELLKILNEISIILIIIIQLKRLASYLYEIPKLTHIWYLNLKDDPNKNKSSIVSQLEDAWIELDSIIGEEILGQGQ